MAIDPARPVRALHAHCERSACPPLRACSGTATRLAAGLSAALFLAAGVAVTPSPATAEAPPFTSGYPHLFYDDTGWLDGRLDVIARFDALTTAFWNGEGPTAARRAFDFLQPLMPRS